MQFQFAEIMGARTRYLVGGKGPAVMLVHGVGMSADSWFWTAPVLARQFQVAAPDLLDNGFTEAGPYSGGPPQPLIVDHLLRLADHLKFDRFSIVGSSLGAAIALLTYFKVPDRINRLVLVGPAHLLNPPMEGSDAFEASYRNGRSALLNPTYESCRARMGRAFFDAARVPDVLVAMQMMMYAMPGALETFERRMAGLRSPASRAFGVHDRLGRVAVPTLVLAGREDIRGPFTEVEKGASKIPSVRLLPYDHCGHWPHMEHPDVFNQDVSAFLSGRST
jgi:4,5:9,10-diseco-3-hydroxy-5,9,17-trioxoandrosta-1(10),2-diene-4-oate hydrolase